MASFTVFTLTQYCVAIKSCTINKYPFCLLIIISYFSPVKHWRWIALRPQLGEGHMILWGRVPSASSSWQKLCVCGATDGCQSYILHPFFPRLIDRLGWRAALLFCAFVFLPRWKQSVLHSKWDSVSKLAFLHSGSGKFPAFVFSPHTFFIRWFIAARLANCVSCAPDEWCIMGRVPKAVALNGWRNRGKTSCRYVDIESEGMIRADAAWLKEIIRS